MNAGIEGPFVMVGHSKGGIVCARIYDGGSARSCWSGLVGFFSSRPIRAPSRNAEGEYSHAYLYADPPNDGADGFGTPVFFQQP